MTERERLIKAKIACPETGIEIRHTLCDICTPQMHCGLDVYVKDGKVIKVEGSKAHPVNKGKLCTKGLCNRQYLYREDRILTPLRRVGARGEGKFEPISWEEAIRTISRRLLETKAQFGADAVFFYSGYSKWYRPMYRRFAHVFGTQNYGTESSACFTSGLMAWQVATGLPAGPDSSNTGLFLGWGFSGYYSRYLQPSGIEPLREKGVKIVVIDPRVTPAQRFADLVLHPRPGTDGALALALGNELIQNGWIDRAYIERYVHGFEEYAAYAKGFNASNVEALTGVPYDQVQELAAMIHEAGRICVSESSAPIGHHRNGLQAYRAIMALTALTGSYDRPGGQLPTPHTYMEMPCGFETREEEFMCGRFPQDAPPAVGAERFPLWYHLRQEAQSMDLSRRILAQEPRPLKALFALGMNLRMFPGDGDMIEALKKLDFFVDVDLFLTDTAKYADIVLPACTSMERGELKAYPGGHIWYTKPVVPPLGESKSDTDILTLLARAMNLDDPLLKAGYDACSEEILRDIPLSITQLEEQPAPVRVPGTEPYTPGARLESGLPTPTGKFELCSALIADHPEWKLEPLPVYEPPLDEAPGHPYLLSAGVRIPNALHSRLHDVPWARSLRPEPCAELSPEDAAALGVEEGDYLRVSTPRGSVVLRALPTATVFPGQVYTYHGYREADMNALLDPDNLDPYSGFPAYRSAHCKLEKAVKP